MIHVAMDMCTRIAQSVLSQDKMTTLVQHPTLPGGRHLVTLSTTGCMEIWAYATGRAVPQCRMPVIRPKWSTEQRIGKVLLLLRLVARPVTR
jgi:hypothetical protein